MNIEQLGNEIISGKLITKEEALQLVTADLDILCNMADKIRKHFCGDGFDICSIINGKSGRCSENCKYCAQAGCYHTELESYALLPAEKIISLAKKNAEQGILRYSIVTSGRKLSEKEVDQACETIRELKKQVNIQICISFGLLDKKQFQKLYDAGVSRIHNNLETSRNYFPTICTSHTYDEKINAIKAAKEVGLNICSGGIVGLGESMEDRIDLALTVRELGVKSVPVNMLNPIPGTALEKQEILSKEEMRRIVAIFRFILPDASIRLAGGRGLMEDKGEACFQSGANAAISGDMLTTSGITAKTDQELIERLGFHPELWNQ